MGGGSLQQKLWAPAGLASFPLHVGIPSTRHACAIYWVRLKLWRAFLNTSAPTQAAPCSGPLPRPMELIHQAIAAPREGSLSNRC